MLNGVDVVGHTHSRLTDGRSGERSSVARPLMQEGSTWFASCKATQGLSQ